MQTLELRNISKNLSYRSILQNINLKIHPGEIHIIEGKSGSGKSTLLSIMGGMEEPTTGEVILKGKKLYDLSDKEQSQIRSSTFGFVFQAFHLLPELTARKNILLPVQINDEQARKFSMEEVAEGLQIDKLLDKQVRYLSGGEQQRVAIARAVINQPSIIFLDEPTGNLDEQTSRTVIDFLLRLHKQYQTSLVIVSHQKKLVKTNHYKYVMSEGMLERVNGDI